MPLLRSNKKVTLESIQVDDVTDVSSETNVKDESKKREDYISWNTFFMGVAKLAAKRSKDPATQVGTCIVSDNKIIGVGYNGMPRMCNDDVVPWNRPEKYLYVCHAELNAIINSVDMRHLKGSTLYTTLFPCNECAKSILQTGIRHILYLDDKYAGTKETLAAKQMFKLANVGFKKLE